MIYAPRIDAKSGFRITANSGTSINMICELNFVLIRTTAVIAG